MIKESDINIKISANTICDICNGEIKEIDFPKSEHYKNRIKSNREIQKALKSNQTFDVCFYNSKWAYYKNAVYAKCKLKEKGIINKKYIFVIDELIESMEQTYKGEETYYQY